MKVTFCLCFLVTLISCSSIFADKHLDEKVFKSGDITVKWYRISEITTIHDFVDIERWGWTKRVAEANTNGICNIQITGDTVTIQGKPDLWIYELAAKTANCTIRVDTSINTCQGVQ